MKYWGLCASAIILLTACSSSSAQAQRQPSASDVVATVGSTQVTLAEVDDKALQQPVSNFGSAKLSQALYEARRAALDEIVAAKLIEAEAKNQHLEPAALIEKEITSKTQTVTEPEVAAWYQTNQARLQGAPLEQVRGPIRNYLTQERTQTLRQQYIDALKARTSVRVTLDPPRQTVAAGNGPARGPANAPVEMIEFSDFQCPFCMRANPTIQQVMSTYGDRVRLVYRHYPLPNHPNAAPAAEAAACAAEQGKFWPYYDRLFANQSRLQDADLKQHAVDLGLDGAKFNACVDTHQFKSLVDADVRAGAEAGVNGTPAFFINGRMLSGAQPFSEFKRIIDDELERKGSR
jgi:protein-disulfide isomerase